MGSRRPRKPDGNELLGRTDYFEHWLREARHHSEQLGWRHDHLSTVLAELKAVFGEDALLKHATRRERMQFAGDPSRHPVGRLIASPSAASTSQLVELAVYLRRCHNIPNVADVVGMLRAPRQYERALVQLALGYRLARLGLAEVAFEPVTDNGRRADVSFVHKGTNYIVECYEPDEPPNPLVNELVQYLPDKVADKAASRQRRVIVRVELHLARLPTALRLQVEQDALALLDAVPWQGRETLLRNEYQIEAIDASGIDAADVDQLAWSMVSDGDWILNPSFIDADDVPRMARGIQPKNQIRLSWTIVSVRERTTPREDARKMATAVANKVAQVRKGQGACGIMLVRTPYARTVALLRPEAPAIVQEFLKHVLAPHPELAGVFLVDRGIAKDKKPFMCGAFLCTRNEDELEPIFEEIRRLEDRRDVTADWE
jgi:hypothetical protein